MTLAQLIEQRRLEDGQRIGNARDPFDFQEWLRGVRDGRAAEAQADGKARQGNLC